MTERTRRALEALGHLGLALLVTFPILLTPASRLLGDGDVDIWNHAWGAWWWFASLAEGQLPWQTDYLLWPQGGVLWFIDPVLALLGLPLVALLDPAWAWNLGLMLYVAFASWSAHRLGLALGASRSAAWVASLAFAASAWMVCELHNGISEAANIGPVALALAWGHEAVEDSSHRRWAKAGLGVGLATICSPYLGLGAGIALALRGLLKVRQAWLGGVVAVTIALPALLAMKLQMADPLAVIKHPPEMNAQLALHNAVDLRTFLQPGGFRSVDLSAEGFEHSMYLGLFALALAVFAARWRWWPALLASVVFALGPYLYMAPIGSWEGGLVPGNLRLPWWLIQKLAPGLAMTHPLRLAVPALALVAGMSAVGAQRLAERLSARVPPRVSLVGLGLLVALDGLVLSGAPWPQDTADARPPQVYEQLQRSWGEAREAGILDLPTDAGETMGTSRYLYWQSAHRRPIPYAPDARASTSSLINVPYFRAAARFSERRADEGSRISVHKQTPVPADGWISGTRDTRIRWIVLHTQLPQDPGLQDELESMFGPGEAIGEALLWDLAEHGWELTPPKDPTTKPPRP